MVATLVFLFSAVFAFAGVEDAELRVKFASTALQEGLYRCPDRVWPGVNWAATGVIFVSRDSNKAWFITQGAKESATVPMSREFASVEDFKITTYRGKTVAVVNLDKYIHDKISLPTALAIHELFHAVGQTGWKLIPPKRGDFFPLDAKPRISRSMILIELQRYGSGDISALSRAAFWFQRWKSESPEEVRFSTDTREGTAKYVERAVVELAREGCGGDLTTQLLGWAQEQSPLTYFGLDAEGYILGAVAGIFLDRSGVEWKQAVARGGLSPLDMLLGGVSPVAGFAEMDVIRAVDVKVYSVNNEVLRLEVPLISPTSAEEYYRVVIPESWLGPSLNVLGIFVPRAAIDQTYWIFNYGQEFKSPRRGNWMILTSPALGLASGDEISPCGERRAGLEFFVPKTQVTQNGGVFNGHTGALDFEFSARVVARNGLSYLCPVTR